MSWKKSALNGQLSAAYVAAGAISLDVDIALVDSTAGAQAMTLADGSGIGEGLKILFVTDGGDLTVTANFVGASNTATFADAGDSLDLVWNGSYWHVIGNEGVALSTV